MASSLKIKSKFILYRSRYLLSFWANAGIWENILSELAGLKVLYLAWFKVFSFLPINQ